MERSVADVLSERLGGTWTVTPHGSSGFCSAWHAQTTGRSAMREKLFVKSARATQCAVLEAEADGLEALAAVDCIRSPAVAGCWSAAPLDVAVLAMEWLEFASSARPGFGERFGQQLAALHASAPVEGGGRYGWRRDNWLGGTPQRNRWSEQSGLQGWLAFFAEERLEAIAEKLSAAGHASALVTAIGRVVDALPGFFRDGHMPRPSLIHGDLWSGNWGSLQDGSPVIFDPAVSISDAEADLAMMELFGAPPAGFWPAYREGAKLSEGYSHRRGLYQLYHVLNHALLFGGGYAGQAMTIIDELLAPG